MRQWWVFLMCVLAALAPAGVHAGMPPTLPLEAGSGIVQLTSLWTWTDPSGTATVEQVASGHTPFAPVDVPRVQPSGSGSALWLALRLQRAADAPPDWSLALPSAILDRVIVYQPDGRRGWRSLRAGDRVPISHWPEAGRYPAFPLHLEHTAALDVYLRIEHPTAMALSVRLAPRNAHERRMRLEYLAIGVALGGLLLLVAGAVWQAATLRARSHTWFATFGLVSTLAWAAYTGLAGQLLWGEHPTWTDAAPGFLGLLASSLWLALVNSFGLATAGARWLAGCIRAAAWLGCVLALAHVFLLPRHQSAALIAGYFGLTAALSLAAAAVSWQRGEPAGRWLMLGAAPLALCVVLALGRLFGLVDRSWLTEYIVVGGLAWSLPLVKAMIDRRLRARRSTQLRQQALASHDPLTGLPKLAPFRARFRRVLSRYATTREPACLLIVAVANLPAIKLSRGNGAAEECLLRAVLKIQKLVRDVDVIARVGDGCFAVLLEGVHGRARVSEFGSHLVASGLMPDPEHPTDPLLHFHVTAALLTEVAEPGVTLIEELFHLLATMSPRTRRPIRYLSPHDARGVGRAWHREASALDRLPEVI
ncbi:diguanylate cyclase [Ramlibacter sp. AW1]|uniref:Diguanylate cyclase n=1 Tax=Ramlibacter aurantiacus TaxID=2801330 RepID=A0A936ZNU7_9BURK|nr:7TM-DISM domain-containing protein [Ramlibacter aurantiacus]MBL0420738.1 diguanylate cyclase [Ramlibacter aurantiacus]